MNEIVKYDNYMNSLKFTGFTAVDYNFLMALCSRMKNQHTNKLIFSFEELREITGYTRTSLKVFANDIMKMNQKLMKMNCTLKQDDEIFQFVLFPTFSTNIKKQTLTVAVNEQFEFILNDLVKNFTRFDLKEFVKLDSKYSKSLYRLLKQFKSTGKLEINLNEFRMKMDIPSTYTNRDVMSKVINPVLAELKNYFQNLQCTVKYEHKRGKPVSGYIFTFKPEQIPEPESKEIPMNEAKSFFEPRKELTQEEMDKLVDEFGKDIVEDYIKRTKAYKCCNYATIRQWILEDRDRKPRSKHQFNNFMQREMTKEQMEELERQLLAN